MTYYGWKICTRKHKIPKAKRQAIWCELKARFNAENTDFSDNDHKFTIHNGQYYFNVKVFFPESENRYGMELKSELTFGYKGEEKAHRTLYNTIIGKIPWEKQGFWLEDNSEIPIPKKVRIRIRHRQIWNKRSVHLHKKSERTEPFRSRR